MAGRIGPSPFNLRSGIAAEAWLRNQTETHYASISQAIQEGDLEEVLELINDDRDESKIQGYQEFALREAMEPDKHDLLQGLWASDCIFPDARKSAISEAVSSFTGNHDLRALEILLQNDADNTYRGYAVVEAAENGDLECLNRLLAKNAIISNKDREDAIDEALGQRHEKCARKLGWRG